ncbi:hypothetical protein CLV59_108342 [Chitinophaga dinghuensis]|uniref:Uncharacterized protein n=1 Tax=Chitinophaga dinghuensis TaxID=1539050 RepID=A0A327VNE4_9BACT|nr:hypothetical protein CLV59_108342 [Chitinophaga dinghuensis]
MMKIGRANAPLYIRLLVLSNAPAKKYIIPSIKYLQTDNTIALR